VIIGLGWTGSIVAQELTDAGLDVIALERGPWRDAPTDFRAQLHAGRAALSRFANELFSAAGPDKFTFRNKLNQTARRSATGAHSCRRTVWAVADVHMERR